MGDFFSLFSSEDLASFKSKIKVNSLLCVFFLFALIALSTLFIYQSHALDVIGAVVVGILIIHFIRKPDTNAIPTHNYRVGFYYFALFVVLCILSVTLSPIGIILAWPALSCLVVSLGYIKLGSFIVNKVNGRISLLSKLILWPWLFGQSLSCVYYSRQGAVWNKITPNLWMGARLSDKTIEQDVVLNNEVKTVCDLTCEFSEAEKFINLGKDYLNFPILDLTMTTVAKLDEIVDKIIDHVGKGVVYVHCKIGYSRSAAIVAAYLLKTKQACGVEQAIEIIRKKRPQIIIRPEIWHALHAYDRFLEINKR